jgi:hypothetical protein
LNFKIGTPMKYIIAFFFCLFCAFQVSAADIAAADVTYSILDQDMIGGAQQLNVVSVTFGDGVDTYPAGGVPLTIGKMGCPTRVVSLNILDEANANGYLYKYDRTNNKIRVYQSAASTHTHNLHLNNADVVDGATTRVNAGADLLGANTGADLLITGVADTSGAGGIVQATIAAAALSELVGGSATPAEATLVVEVRCY